MTTRRLLVAGGCALMTLCACGGGDVTGHWCGLDVASDADCVGDEATYLEVTESGDVATGQACEAFEKECYPLENGAFDGSRLTYRYTFSSGYVDATYDLDGDTLVGSLYASKCDCEIPKTLHRLD